MFLGIVATKIKTLTIELDFINDVSIAPTKEITLATNNTYSVVYIGLDGTTISTLTGVLTSMQEITTDSLQNGVYPTNNGIVRERPYTNIGFGNSPYIDQRVEYCGLEAPEKDVNLVFTVNNNTVTIKLSQIRDVNTVIV